MNRRAFGVTLAALATWTFAAAPASAASCDLLTKLALPNATVTSAVMVPAGTFTAPGQGRGASILRYAKLPAFCRAFVTSKPTQSVRLLIVKN